MTDDPFYAPNASAPPPRVPRPGELLFEFLRGSDLVSMSCELRFHGESYGWGGAILRAWRTLRQPRGTRDARARGTVGGGRAESDGDPVVSGTDSVAEIVRSLVADPEYVRLLTARIAARTERQDIIERPIAYARERQATSGRAIVRRLLTDAGVSWEAL